MTNARDVLDKKVRWMAIRVALAAIVVMMGASSAVSQRGAPDKGDNGKTADKDRTPKAPAEIAIKVPEKKLAPKREFAQEYVQPFQENIDKIPGWELMPASLPDEVRTGPEGLRITMPLGHEGRRDNVGVKSFFGVKGDFEITLRFEIFHEPDPRDIEISGTGLNLRVDLDGPAGNETTSLGRSVRPEAGSVFFAYQWVPTRKDKAFFRPFPTKAKKGQLRLIRTGKVLAFYAAEEASEQLVFLCELPFGDTDLKRVCIFGATGGSKTSLDVRVTDFRIRAESFPNLPAAAVRNVAARDGVPIAVPTARGSGWLAAVLVMGLGGPLLLGGIVIGWLVLRQRHAGAEPIETEAVKPIPVMIACSACGKRLKVNHELVGKKVK